MSFHVPSDELDFAIYGDANTNQLQLSTSQHRLLQKQRLDIAAVMPQVQAEEGEQNLTGYQSGLFDPLGRKPHRETKKKHTSIVFADLPFHSPVDVIDSTQQLQQYQQKLHEQQYQQQQQPQQQQKPRKLASRHGSIKIDTSLETIHSPPSSSGPSRANESVQQPHRLKQQVQQHQRQQQQYEAKQRASSRQSQSSPNLVNKPVTDQAAKEVEREQINNRQDHTETASATTTQTTAATGAAEVVVMRGGNFSRSQQVPSSSPTLRHARHQPFLPSSASHSIKHHANTTSVDNNVSEEDEGDVEAVVQSLEMVQRRLKSGDGLFLDPEEGQEGSSALRPPIARSATIISTTSSNGRLRLTHRLSYLAHSQDLEVDEDDDIPLPLPALVGIVPTPSFQPDRPSAAIVTPISAPFVAPLSAPVFPSAPMAPPTFSDRRTSLPVKQTIPPPHLAPSSAPQPKATSHSKSVGVFSQKPPILQSSHQPTVAPPFGKLYKRLLRVFKPPTDSSDSDQGQASTQSPPVSPSRGRGPFGLPSNPDGHGSSHGSSSSHKGSKSAPSSKRPSLSNASPQAPVILPSLAAAAKIALGGGESPHKAPESSSGGGFRARFLRRLISSPNLNASSVYPTTSNSAPSSRVDLTKLDVSLATLKSRGGLDDQLKQPPSPYSPLPSDFEHDQSCPAGQKMMERRSAGGRPRSATTSRVPAPMPTLQSKYGVPGRELGAGTQAQVMLLRVKSSKRLRSPKSKASALRSKPASASSPSSSAAQQQRETLSPVDHEPAAVEDSLLAPYARTGTMMTTTEDEVTPEQREAYRKRLLRRTSTGGLSTTNGGGLIYAIKKFRPPRGAETHRQFLKKVCAEFCISTSMDHENIIRTLDLVRDQPGQELVDDEIPQEKESRHSDRHSHHRHRHSRHKDDCGDSNEDEVDYVKTEQHRREEARDCSCPRTHHRRVRTIKSTGDLINQGGSHSGSSVSGSSTPKSRPIVRKSAISKPQRKRSVDALSNRRSIVGHPDRSPAAQSVQPESSGHRHRHLNHWRGDAHNASSSQPSSQEKKKQQQEQELRQKEVLRLKQQREREKQQAKQFRLDQFPEYCMVMEFAAGGDLFNLLTKSHPPISLYEKHCLWRQLINGVQYMHSMGVAHRDLKPENILIDGTGRILKITDFGIANVFKSVGDPIPLPCRGIIGSEPYIAPEEFYQEEYDPRAVDVWACGIIFYVMYYAAMPWARADRKKDARFSRFISDITHHRHSEAQRRLQYERRQLYHQSLTSGSSGGRVGSGSVGSGSTRSGSASGTVDAYTRPHEVNHQPQYPPYNPNQHLHQRVSLSSTGSSRSGSPTSPHQNHAAGVGSDSPQSSVDNSPVSSKPANGPLSSSSPDPLASSPTSTTPIVPPAVYNTYPYNNYLGGHEFIDRIETPGCRRILYAILEPDARKRLTIDQVLADEWVSRIRYCTDNLDAQKEQACMVFGKGAVTGLGGGGERYLCMPNGKAHHRHAVPKKVKTT